MQGFLEGILDRTAEFLLQLQIAHFNESRSTMRAGVRHRTLAKVREQSFEFWFAHGIIGLDGVPADGFGDHIFTQPHGVHP